MVRKMNEICRDFPILDQIVNDERLVYLDNAATTKTRPEVVEAMLPYFTEYYGNPSSVYEFATPSKKAIAEARETIAKSLGAKTNEIYFTAGGSESDNWAVKNIAAACKKKGRHIITTNIEHHAIFRIVYCYRESSVGSCGQ